MSADLMQWTAALLVLVAMIGAIGWIVKRRGGGWTVFLFVAVPLTLVFTAAWGAYVASWLDQSIRYVLAALS